MYDGVPSVATKSLMHKELLAYPDDDRHIAMSQETSG
jgi:hypothetical protein